MMKNKEIISRGLIGWSNYIQTGTLTLSAMDVERSDTDRIKALTIDQMRVVVALHDMAADALKGKPLSKDIKERQKIFYALNMWANYIETNDVNMSADLASKSDNHKSIRQLQPEQVELVERIRHLADEALQDNLTFGDRDYVSVLELNNKQQAEPKQPVKKLKL